MATLNIKGFPDPLYQALKERAERNGRSLSSEVTRMLEERVAESPRANLREWQGRVKGVFRDEADVLGFLEAERKSW